MSRLATLEVATRRRLACLGAATGEKLEAVPQESAVPQEEAVPQEKAVAEKATSVVRRSHCSRYPANSGN